MRSHTALLADAAAAAAVALLILSAALLGVFSLGVTAHRPDDAARAISSHGLHSGPGPLFVRARSG